MTERTRIRFSVAIAKSCVPVRSVWRLALRLITSFQQTVYELEKNKLAKHVASLEDDLLNQRKNHLAEKKALDKKLQEANDAVSALEVNKWKRRLLLFRFVFRSTQVYVFVF